MLRVHARHTPDNNRALAACTASKGDVLLVQSEHDEVVPRPVIDSYAWAFGNARSLVRHTLLEADHALSQARWRRTYHAIVVDWPRERRRGGVEYGCLWGRGWPIGLLPVVNTGAIPMDSAGP